MAEILRFYWSSQRLEGIKNFEAVFAEIHIFFNFIFQNTRKPLQLSTKSFHRKLSHITSICWSACRGKNCYLFWLTFERTIQVKKLRPTSASSIPTPVYKKLRPVEDPIIQILDQIHKILFITQVMNLYKIY